MKVQHQVPLEGVTHQLKPSNSAPVSQHGSGLSYNFLAKLLGVDTLNVSFKNRILFSTFFTVGF
jgi:hypothetical protein